MSQPLAPRGDVEGPGDFAVNVLPRTVDEVKAYALEHYEDGGWDVIVECWSDDDIALALADNTLYAAIDIFADRQADAINSAF
jgi:hypothetical protein